MCKNQRSSSGFLTLQCAYEQWETSLNARSGSTGPARDLSLCPYYKFPGEITVAFEQQGPWSLKKKKKNQISLNKQLMDFNDE